MCVGLFSKHFSVSKAGMKRFRDLPCTCVFGCAQVGISEDVVDGIVDEVQVYICICGGGASAVFTLLLQVLDGVCTSAEALVTSLRARGVPGRKALAVKAALASPIVSVLFLRVCVGLCVCVRVWKFVGVPVCGSVCL